MVDCVPLVLEQVRARIEIGPYYYVTTGTDSNSAGDIMSFSINKARNQPIATFRCSLAVYYDKISFDTFDYVDRNLGHKIIVYAGVGTRSDRNLPKLFTGYVTNMTQDPHWDDARKFILNISGEDEFAKMRRSKFSRRFRMSEDAYAVITSGKRREGGKMTQLKRVPAGHKGVDFRTGGSSGGNGSLDHSPLTRTPDPQGRSPNAARLTGSRQTAEKPYTQLRFEPSFIYANVGDRIYTKIMDATTGEELNTRELSNTVGQGCLLCMSPNFGSSGSGANKTEGMTPGTKTYPVRADYGSASDPTAKGIEFTITAAYPGKVTFIHPLTGATCTIEFQQIPPHDHRDMPRGGPAVGTYDVFQV